MTSQKQKKKVLEVTTEYHKESLANKMILLFGRLLIVTRTHVVDDITHKYHCFLCIVKNIIQSYKDYKIHLSYKICDKQKIT